MEKLWLANQFRALIGEGQQFRTRAEAARFLGLPASQATKFFDFLDGKDTRYQSVMSWLEQLGGKVLGPGQTENTREVCFVNARVVNSGDNAPPVVPEDYLAVPLVSEAGAGPGIIPVNEHESWFLVYRSEPSLRMRSNLIAVRIAKNSTSMEPTLHPGDIVLVDRDDKAVVAPGRIWLVMEPDGAGKIKRVKVDDLRPKRQTRLTFYSDNVQENPPEVYSLEEDYNGEWDRAIVGRVVWAWSDLSRK